jgi:hypothetical protein
LRSVARSRHCAAMVGPGGAAQICRRGVKSSGQWGIAGGRPWMACRSVFGSQDAAYRTTDQRYPAAPAGSRLGPQNEEQQRQDEARMR